MLHRFIGGGGGGTGILYPEKFFSLPQVQIPKIKHWRDLYTDSTLVANYILIFIDKHNTGYSSAS